jgi:hypothetical protein
MHFAKLMFSLYPVEMTQKIKVKEKLIDHVAKGLKCLSLIIVDGSLILFLLFLTFGPWLEG